jgi:hypothetical protein
VANHGDKTALRRDFDPQHTRPVIGVVVGDALYQPDNVSVPSCRSR